jgi:methylmalonyl-CoA mutase C-terminal domain/subunit
MSARPIKVLLGKLGLDGHDRGIKVIAKALRDAGMEVIYLGMRLTPDQVAQAAIHEDVDVIGISLLSGAHMRLVPKLTGLLKEKGVLDEILVVLGGTIPDQDIPKLKELGVDGIFPVGTSLEEIIHFIQGHIKRKIEKSV